MSVRVIKIILLLSGIKIILRSIYLIRREREKQRGGEERGV